MCLIKKNDDVIADPLEILPVPEIQGEKNLPTAGRKGSVWRSVNQEKQGSFPGRSSEFLATESESFLVHQLKFGTMSGLLSPEGPKTVRIGISLGFRIEVKESLALVLADQRVDLLFDPIFPVGRKVLGRPGLRGCGAGESDRGRYQE